MNNNPIFEQKINCKTPNEVFDYLIATLQKTIKSWDYFVKWDKVMKKYHKVESSLNLLNTLVGKANIEEEATALLTKNPKIISVIPDLVAYRDKSTQLLSDINTFTCETFEFCDKMPVTQAVRFLKESGFLELIADGKIKSVPDYFIGVEVGLDSNGRKNRSGTAMEDIIELFIKDICDRNDFEYITQATADKIFQKWGKKITVNKSSKRIDFAINTPQKLFLIETNFYGGGGSKLKSTAGEYADIYKQWTKDGHQFVWITDGLGWKTTQRPLRDTFDVTDYILNIDMVRKGILEALLK